MQQLVFERGLSCLINNMGALIEKVQKMQQELRNMTIEISEEGGACKIVINGHQEVQDIKIAPSLLRPEQAGVLESLILKTVNKAIVESKNIIKSEVSKMTGGMNFPNIPGMF
ncbi:YbaB/EbfC family nucleoid-associated protein [Pelotomaculum schinkii]|uniref:YbaB/EbfC family nucleoid-associated protein n=1 Tax=Pelotomaculum schinkii TaxID=78350 RepID=UPI00249E6539|nr:YbaB/EbfC family nucleoid-associated protein [Pelotomaculum schinkii]